MVLYFHKLTPNGWDRVYSTDRISDYNYEFPIKEVGDFAFNTAIDTNIEVDMIVSASDPDIPAGIIDSISFEPDTGLLRIAGSSLLSLLERRRPYSIATSRERHTVGDVLTIFSQDLQALTGSANFISCDPSDDPTVLSQPMQNGDRTWLKFFADCYDRQHVFHLDYDFYADGGYYKLKYKPVYYEDTEVPINVSRELHDGRAYTLTNRDCPATHRFYFKPQGSYIYAESTGQFLSKSWTDLPGSYDNLSLLDRFEYENYDNFGEIAGKHDGTPYYSLEQLEAKVHSEFSMPLDFHQYECVLINPVLDTHHKYTIYDADLDLTVDNMIVSIIDYVYVSADSGTEVIKMYTLTNGGVS